MQKFKKKQRGFTVFELLMAFAILSVLTAIAISYSSAGFSRSKIQTAESDVGLILDDARTWRNAQTSYDGISLLVLCNQKLLSHRLCASGFINPWGGIYQLVTNDSNGENLKLTVTNVKKPELFRKVLLIVSIDQNNVIVSGNNVIGEFD